MIRSSDDHTRFDETLDVNFAKNWIKKNDCNNDRILAQCERELSHYFDYELYVGVHACFIEWYSFDQFDAHQETASVWRGLLGIGITYYPSNGVCTLFIEPTNNSICQINLNVKWLNNSICSRANLDAYWSNSSSNLPLGISLPIVMWIDRFVALHLWLGMMWMSNLAYSFLATFLQYLPSPRTRRQMHWLHSILDNRNDIEVVCWYLSNIIGFKGFVSLTCCIIEFNCGWFGSFDFAWFAFFGFWAWIHTYLINRTLACTKSIE